MQKEFEDAFMDFQSSLISLCLEVTENNVDVIYAYCSNEKKSKMFNAFVCVDGEVKTISQLGVQRSRVFQFLQVGTVDLEKLDKLCEEYNKPVPREIKMIYDVKTGKFDASYKYEEVCGPKSDKSSGEVFMEWLEEVKNKQS